MDSAMRESTAHKFLRYHERLTGIGVSSRPLQPTSRHHQRTTTSRAYRRRRGRARFPHANERSRQPVGEHASDAVEPERVPGVGRLRLWWWWDGRISLRIPDDP
jgi:hypothetical protein